jgi:hypothetical protein
MQLYTPDIVYLFPAYLELQSSTAAITGLGILCTLLSASAKRSLALSTCLTSKKNFWYHHAYVSVLLNVMYV